VKKISWCKQKKGGIKLIQPNENLSEEYMQNAEESMKVLRAVSTTKSNMWIATTKYYMEYFAIYALLMKLGIKCEIHECTLELVIFLEKETIVKQGTYALLVEDKELRIDNQYYLKNKPVHIDFDELADFLISVKQVIRGLSGERIGEIRKKLQIL